MGRAAGGALTALNLALGAGVVAAALAMFAFPEPPRMPALDAPREGETPERPGATPDERRAAAGDLQLPIDTTPRPEPPPDDDWGSRILVRSIWGDTGAGFDVPPLTGLFVFLGESIRDVAGAPVAGLEGVVLERVEPGSVWALLELRAGDVLSRVNQSTVNAPSDAQELERRLREENPSQVTLLMNRAGRQVVLVFRLKTR